MKIFILTILLTIPYSLLSQELQTLKKVEAGINGLAYSWEIPATEKITIEPAIGLGQSCNITSKMIWYWDLLDPSLHISAYGKLFYNRDKRLEKGKSLLNNSGHFIGIKIKYVSTPYWYPEYFSNTLLTNFNWGGQFNLGKHWQYSYSLGFGYGRNLDNPYVMFYPAFDVKIAYILPLK